MSKFLSQIMNKFGTYRGATLETEHVHSPTEELSIPKPKAYDRYTSLGRDCEVGFQLKRVLGRPETGFFNWNITEPDALISLLQNDFSGILLTHNLSVHTGGQLIKDASHNFMIHHEFDPIHFKNAPDFDVKLNILRDKFEYFKQKFKENASETGRIAYFYKCTNEDAQNIAIKVRELLMNFHKSDDFDVIILQTQDRYEPDWGIHGVYNRYLKRFAPYDDTPDAHVPSWDALFQEFPHVEPLNLINY